MDTINKKYSSCLEEYICKNVPLHIIIKYNNKYIDINKMYVNIYNLLNRPTKNGLTYEKILTGDKYYTRFEKLNNDLSDSYINEKYPDYLSIIVNDYINNTKLIINFYFQIFEYTSFIKLFIMFIIIIIQ